MLHCAGSTIALQSRHISQTSQYMIQESLQKCLREKTKTCGVSEHAANKSEARVVEEHVGTHIIGGDRLSLDTAGATSSQSYAKPKEQGSHILAAPIALRDSDGAHQSTRQLLQLTGYRLTPPLQN